MENNKRLYRSRKDRIFAGVCGGLAEYFDIEPLIFRVVFLVLILGGGSGLLIYILLAIVVPNEPGDSVTFDRGDKIRNFAEDLGDRAKTFAHEFKSSSHPESSVNRTETHSQPAAGSRTSQGSRRNFLGIVIVLFGIALLLNQIFPIGWFHWNLFWPALLIVIGIAMLTKHNL